MCPLVTISLEKDKSALLARLFSIRSSSWIRLVCTLAGNLNADGVRLQFANFDLIHLTMCAAGCRAPESESKDPHDLRANPKVQLAQAKRFATGVLEHYNRNKKVCYTIYLLVLEKSMICILDWRFALS